MAGTLPGVESARRRKFHHSASDNSASWTRKSTSSSSLRSTCYAHAHHEDVYKLVGVAREAKERLDEKLRTQRMKVLAQPRVAKREDIGIGLKKSGWKERLMGMKLGWTTKLAWNRKTSDQDECCICLDRFKLCESLVQLPCAHRFHSKCLGPWIECNAHCPCCRMSLASSNS